MKGRTEIERKVKGRGNREGEGERRGRIGKERGREGEG